MAVAPTAVVVVLCARRLLYRLWLRCVLQALPGLRAALEAAATAAAAAAAVAVAAVLEVVVLLCRRATAQ